MRYLSIASLGVFCLQLPNLLLAQPVPDFSQSVVLTGHTSDVNAVVFSPDGKMLASGSSDNSVRLWDATQQKQIGILNGHTKGVTSLAFSPDGKTLASGSADNSVLLWDVAQQKQIGAFTGHGGGVAAVAFSPDGITLASGAGDATIRLWDVVQQRRVGFLTGHPTGVTGMAFSPDGKTLASSSGSPDIYLWDVAQQSRVGILSTGSSTTSVAFSPDGKILASGYGSPFSDDHVVYLWDVAQRSRVGVLVGHTSTVNSVAFSPDGKLLVTGGEQTVRVWDVSQRKMVSLLIGHTSTVKSVAFSPDGKTLASGSVDKTGILWRSTSASSGPVISLSASALVFENTGVGSTSQKTITVSNTGNADLSITGIAVSGTDASQFKVSPATLTAIAAGQNGIVNVTFSPTSSGNKAASLSITHNASGTTSTVSLSGTAITNLAPAISVSPTSLSFGNVTIGSFGQQSLRIKNIGTAALSITSIRTGVPFSSSSAGPLSVSPGDSTTVTITFSPTAVGLLSGDMTITHNASGNTSTIPMSGTGVQPTQPPALSFTPTSLSFGEVLVGQGKVDSVTVRNTGGGNLKVVVEPLAGDSAGDFEAPARLEVNLTGGQSRTLAVTFRPKSKGEKKQVLLLTHNSSGSTNPIGIPLSGTGIEASGPGISVSPTPMPFGDVEVNQGRTLALSITNTGDAPLTVSGITISGADAGQFLVPLTSFTISDRGGSHGVTVTFSPTSAGPKAATLTVAHSVPGVQAVTVSLSGIGVTGSTTGGVTLSVSNVSGTAGQTGVVVSISVDNAKGIAGGDLTLTYDASVLIARQVRPADLLTSSGITVIPNLGTAGQVKVSMAGAAGIPSGSGVLVSIIFDVKGSAASRAYDLGLQARLRDDGGTVMPATARNGLLTIGSTPSGVSAPAVSLSSGSLSFGSVNVGSQGVQTLTITNSGASALTTASEIALTGPDAGQFAVIPRTFNLAPGASQALTVTLTPSSAGAISASLTISHNASGSPSTVVLTGTGVGGPSISMSLEALEMDSTRVGSTSQKAFTISNAGSGALSVGSIAVGGPDAAQFKVSPTTVSISAGGQAQSITVTFAPTSAGPKIASVSILHNATGGPLSVALRGVAVFNTREVPGPVSLDLNAAENDQGRRTKKGVKPGSKISIQLFVKDAPAISGFVVRLEFDPAVLKVGGFTASEFVPDKLSLAPTQPSPGIVDLGVGNLTSATRSGNGLLGTITFEVTDKFSKETYVAATQVTFNQPGGKQQEVKQRSLVTLIEGGSEGPDYNQDGFVDFSDFFLFAAVFGTQNADFDLNGDGFVDFNDFFVFAAAFGQKVGKPTTKLALSGDEPLSSDIRLALRTGPGPLDRMTVQVILQGARSLKGYAFALRYDPERWSFEDANAGAGIPMFVARPDGAGGLQVVGAVANGSLDLERPVAELRFRRLRQGGPPIAATGGTVLSAEGRQFALSQQDLLEAPEGGAGYVLRQNYPNPFNPATRITYQIPSEVRVRLVVFNLLGQQVRVLEDGIRAAGAHAVEWDGRDSESRLLGNGVYFCRLQTTGFEQTRRMVLSK